VCAISGSDENLLCWGGNHYGQLGIGVANSTYVTAPTAVCSSGSGAGCPKTNNVTHVAAGDNHTCARFLSGAVACWGNNGSGALGFTADGTPHPNPLFISGLNAGFSSANPIVAGELTSCAVLSDNTVKCWGYNAHGQLGIGNSTSSIPTPTNVCQPVSGSCSGPMQVADLTLGETHGCAVTGGAVRCWGWNQNGVLGDGNTTGYKTNLATAIPIPSGAVGVGGGAYHTCAILNDGTLKCWGWASTGQIGTGPDIEDVRSPTAPAW
jgi:alpha-tubulin suppressor-like RCC1 family protein